MKKISLSLISLVALAVLVSGCVQVGFEDVKAYIGVGEPQYTATEKLSISGKSVLDEVRGGTKTTLRFHLRNEGNVTVKNASIEITDPCVFDSPGVKDVGDLEPGQPFSWDPTLKSSRVDMTKTCEVRYRVSYLSKANALYDLLAMSEEEYLRLKKKGEFENRTTLNYYKTDTPVDPRISLSKEQPIHGGEKFYLYLKFVNQGGGKVKGQKLGRESVNLTYPDFLIWKDGWCQGAMEEESGNRTLGLNRSRTFLEKETAPITCKFKVNGSKVEIQKQGIFKVRVKYKYVVDKKLSVKVIPS